MQKTFSSPKSGATTKLKCWRSQGIPMDDDERAVYRQLAVEAVYAIWNREHRPTHLSEIYPIVRQKIKELIATGKWQYKAFRSKRSVDRRVNEAASEKFGFPRIVAVTAGIYQPNMELFVEVKKR